MKEKEEVLDRFWEMKNRYLKERKASFLDRLPINCVSNVRVRVKTKGQFGICQNQEIVKKNGLKPYICQDPDAAKACGLYCCKHTEESVESDFNRIMSNPAQCGSEYPKLGMLIWFLQGDSSLPRGARLKRNLKKVLKDLFYIITFKWW
jgi:hypothetical protein